MAVEESEVRARVVARGKMVQGTAGRAEIVEWICTKKWRFTGVGAHVRIKYKRRGMLHDGGLERRAGRHRTVGTSEVNAVAERHAHHRVNAVRCLKNRG